GIAPHPRGARRHHRYPSRHHRRPRGRLQLTRSAPMQPSSRQHGFTLLEVMIAVIIFSVGLLGVAGLMVLSMRTNHSAFLRTQASFLAESMAERMRTNLGYIDQYNGTYSATVTAAGTNCATTACTPRQLAAYDRQIWNQQLIDHLPAPTAV